jgi:hypothetical protein
LKEKKYLKIIPDSVLATFWFKIFHFRCDTLGESSFCVFSSLSTKVLITSEFSVLVFDWKWTRQSRMKNKNNKISLMEFQWSEFELMGAFGSLSWKYQFDWKIISLFYQSEFGIYLTKEKRRVEFCQKVHVLTGRTGFQNSKKIHSVCEEFARNCVGKSQVGARGGVLAESQKERKNITNFDGIYIKYK